MLRMLLTLVCGLLCLASTAGDTLSLKRAIPIDARLMTVDELGNVYVVRKNNSLVRYTADGDSSNFYRSITNGDIGSIDATNPLRVIVYYPMYSKVVILDRMLAYKNELNLTTINILRPAAVAASADGTLWVYDRFNAKLKRIKEDLTEVAQSNDLRQQLDEVPIPSYMTERERRLYICDTARGIYLFDQYGNYINTLAITGVTWLQVYGQQLVYRLGDILHSYDMQSIASHKIALPHTETTILQAAIVRNTLYVLYEDGLELYNIKE